MEHCGARDKHWRKQKPETGAFGQSERVGAV
jgi:hypothetical protein